MHPSLLNVNTSYEVSKMRPHIKMLSGNYLTFKKKSEQSGGSPHCRLCLRTENPCSGSEEALEHLIAFCESLCEPRTRIMSELQLLCNQTQSNIHIYNMTSHEFTQLILDPSSFNLEKRIHFDDIIFGLIESSI